MDVVDTLIAGQTKEASAKIANLSDVEVERLQQELSKISGAEMPTKKTEQVATAKDRDEVDEKKSRTEARAAKTDYDHVVGKGSEGTGPEDVNSASPTIADLLNVPIKETIRVSSGDSEGNKKDLKKQAEEFNAGYVAGIRGAIGEITQLVEKRGSLNLSNRFGEAFDKIASRVGEEAATNVLLHNFAEGQKQAMIELTTQEEVKMGSLRNLVEDQEKIASTDDLGSYGYALGREALLTKIAEEQAIEEAMAADAGAAELEEAAAVAEVLDVLAEKALEDPDSLTDEEAEVLLEAADAVEDAELEIEGDEEKVTTVMDIIAAINYYS